MVRRDVVAARPLAQQLHRAELGHQVGERAPVASEEAERRSLVEARVFFGIAHAADDLAAHRLGEIEAGPEHRDQRSEERLQRSAGFQDAATNFEASSWGTISEASPGVITRVERPCRFWRSAPYSMRRNVSSSCARNR